MKQSRKPRKSSRYAIVLLGTSVIAASALAVITPALASRTAAPSRAYFPALRIAPNLSILPAAGRRGLAATKSKELFGVFCNTPSDCWAVGETAANHVTENQVLHWTGKKWFAVKVPNPAGTAPGDLNELFAIRCTSARNCWAVGDSRHGNDAELNQALRFNGQKWSVAATPAPGGTAPGDLNGLIDVACTSADSCWAVGAYGILGPGINPEVLFNQALHWDGKKWTFIKSPDPAGVSMGDANTLESVRCTALDDCWAAGTGGTFKNSPKLHNAMLHWNGKKWTKVTVPSPVRKGKVFVNELNTLACTATDNCWAVGLAGLFTGPPKGFQHNEALHWTGKKWSLVKTPEPGGVVNDLLGVTCTAADNCWAVGVAGAAPGLNEALHWNSRKWSVVRTPDGGGTGKTITNTLSSVRCTSASYCWAVGDVEVVDNVDINQFLHWNGTKWQDTDHPG